MSVRSGRKTSRYPLDVYKGFRIIKVKIIEYYRSSFSREYTNYPEKIETHYTFCKEGEEKRPSQDYNVWAKTQHECIECIDKFIKDNSLYYTHEEREKYVYKPNQKCGWGYGYESLMKLLKAHQKADKRMKILIEDRLTDANFHAESGFLSEGKYDEFIKIVRKTYPFRETIINGIFLDPRVDIKALQHWKISKYHYEFKNHHQPHECRRHAGLHLEDQGDGQEAHGYRCLRRERRRQRRRWFAEWR